MNISELFTIPTNRVVVSSDPCPVCPDHTEAVHKSIDVETANLIVALAERATNLQLDTTPTTHLNVGDVFLFISNDEAQLFQVIPERD